MSLDSDILVPQGYVKELVSTLTKLAKKRGAGIVAPAVLRAEYFPEMVKRLLGGSTGKELRQRLSKAGRGFLKAELRSAIARLGESGKRSVYYHLGVRDWKSHYLSSQNLGARFVARVWGFLLQEGCSGMPPEVRQTFLAHDPQFVSAIQSGKQPVQVDCLPGGLHCYSVETWKAVGAFDERFSPFGYEDVDFCIRAQKTGLTNYLIPQLAVIHDVAERYVTRPLAYNAYLRGRAKRILIRKHVASRRERLYYRLDALLDHPRVIWGMTDRRKHAWSLRVQATLCFLAGFFGVHLRDLLKR